LKALDVSFSSISQSWFEARKAEGYELFIQDAWTGSLTPASALPNIANARAAGLLIAVYSVVSYAHPGKFAADVVHAVSPYWSEYNFVAVDVEEIEGLPDPTADQIQECIDRIRELGQRPILYSRRNFISQYPDFGIPTWMAKYDGVAELEPGDIGKQFSGTTLIGGVEVDLSVFDDTFVRGEDMSQDDINAIKQVLSQFADTDNAIKEVLAQHNARLAALESHPSDAAEADKLIADIEARIEKAGKDLAGD